MVTGNFAPAYGHGRTSPATQYVSCKQGDASAQTYAMCRNKGGETVHASTNSNLGTAQEYATTPSPMTHHHQHYSPPRSCRGSSRERRPATSREQPQAGLWECSNGGCGWGSNTYRPRDGQVPLQIVVFPGCRLAQCELHAWDATLLGHHIPLLLNVRAEKRGGGWRGAARTPC